MFILIGTYIFRLKSILKRKSIFFLEIQTYQNQLYISKNQLCSYKIETKLAKPYIQVSTYESSSSSTPIIQINYIYLNSQMYVHYINIK
jgi:hypothetical protein